MDRGAPSPFTLGPGSARAFDPAEILHLTSACSSLTWVAAWRASDTLTAAFIQKGVRNDIGRGRWGTSTLGCSSLELRNDGTTSVVAEVDYEIGTP